MPDPNEPMLSEDDARRVLARAAELDVHAQLALSESQLRDVAAEAGLAERAVSQALSELREGRLLPDTRIRRLTERIGTWRRMAYLLCYLSAAFITPGDFIATTGLLALAFIGVFEIALRGVRSLGEPPRPRPSATSTSSQRDSTTEDPQVFRRMRRVRILATAKELAV